MRSVRYVALVACGLRAFVLLGYNVLCFVRLRVFWLALCVAFAVGAVGDARVVLCVFVWIGWFVLCKMCALFALRVSFCMVNM